MKVLYLDCGMGAAGDMLLGALLGLHPDPAAFLARLDGLVPHTRVEAAQVERCGVRGTKVTVTVDGHEEGAHCPDGGHHHGHGSRGLGDIRALVGALPVSEGIQAAVLKVYERIAQAEAAAHGQPVGLVHFHEVGALDAVADILGVCLLIEELAPGRILASPVRVGYGQVRCAHGVLPVPAPATAALLKGVPIYAGDMEGELCTPTGAALVAHFAAEFGPMPLLRLEGTGYGAGSRELPAANLLRAFWGELEEGAGDRVCELCCNLDDMSGEALAFACETLLEAGALDVALTPIQMKKGRPGHMLACLCEPNREAEFAALLLRHTSTLGVRAGLLRRYTLQRAEETVQTPYGPARRKTAWGYGVNKGKYEYEDAARMAREQGLPFAEMVDRLP